MKDRICLIGAVFLVPRTMETGLDGAVFDFRTPNLDFSIKIIDKNTRAVSFYSEPIQICSSVFLNYYFRWPNRLKHRCVVTKPLHQLSSRTIIEVEVRSCNIADNFKKIIL